MTRIALTRAQAEAELLLAYDCYITKRSSTSFNIMKHGSPLVPAVVIWQSLTGIRGRIYQRDRRGGRSLMAFGKRHYRALVEQPGGEHGCTGRT